jgi:hypothetical protein
MLSLLNKSSGDKAATHFIPWRPDFRDVSQLPDTKTVRTNFFVNLVAMAVAGFLGLLVGQREWEIHDLRRTINETDARIAETRPNSEKAQATYAQFIAEEKKFQEANELVKNGFRFPDLVLHLGKVLPSDVYVRRVDFRGLTQNVLVAASVKGLDASASDIASSFVQKLQADPFLLQHFSEINMTNIGRNVDEGNLNFELVFVFKTAEAPKPASISVRKP